MSMLNKTLLLVSRFAAGKTGREQLQGVFVQQDRTAATDSFTLAEVRVKGEKPDPKDFPISQAGAAAQELKETIIIPTQTAKTISSAIPKKQNLPILNNAAFFGKTDDGKMTFIATDLETYQPITFRPVDGSYPDYSKIIPKSEARKGVVHLDADYLLKAAQFLKDFYRAENSKFHKSVEIEFHGELESVVFKVKSLNHEATVLVMPMRNN